ncbi:hypothetical protein F5Y00DRAFT_266876 [Daldinia vernicosa]|uniref:uncharacterized protein n=1 Tax=Daldinia vernicosa TaxID=114800 RepID=UPI002007F6AC|nr:uncharacterized protein F5Y00DRAFT_266876 [Daldinia vernicosa]KAI0844148.1 hypothetical protein F5Y00DRAFT_266876 [Daldinia vernicosa]
MDSSRKELGNVLSVIADLTQRIETLEKAFHENSVSRPKGETGAEKEGDKSKQEVDSAVQQDSPQVEDSEETKTDLLRKFVEFRKEVPGDDLTTQWVSDSKADLETEDSPSGRQSFRYDTTLRGDLIFTVYKSAALHGILSDLCPPAHEGQVKVFDDRLEIIGAYPLLHCRNRLMAMEKTDVDEDTKAELEVMRQLYERKSHLIRTGKHLDELIKKQKIDYDGLRGLFRKDQLVVFRELRDEWAVARVRTFTIDSLDDIRYNTDELQLECEAIDSDGKNYKNRLYRKEIEKFVGTKNITELEVYPLQFHPGKESLIEISIKSGKRWCELHAQLNESGQPVAKVMQYVGYCETFIEGSNDDGVGREIAGRVIVDPTKFPDRCITFVEHNIDPFGIKCLDGETEVDSLVLCPEKVLVYSLSDNEWYNVAMRKLEFPTWIQSAWKRLVKPESTLAADSIDRIQRLARAHAHYKQAREIDKNPNNFRGKGKGLTFLLHGPPGVGKTMLAECLSEEHQRPLYRVNLGMLVADDSWESTIEEIFRQAHFWDAILLIDEAEVVMSERTPENMRSSAWVAVFLRKIEYFEGILFLTTNQIHMIDPAFISRVNLGMAFPELEYETRLQIWKSIFSQDDDANAAIWLSDSKETTLRKWATKPLNGRQIRNVIYSARLLGDSGGKITENGIEDCLRDVINFMDMIEKKKKENDMSYMSHWS